MLQHTTLSDFYDLLQIPRDASPNDIKIAYHRTLLRLHPDKQTQSRYHDARIMADPPPLPPPEELEATVDVALLKEAYRTLSDGALRMAYDTSLKRHERERARAYGPRPAQVVSLEEFTAVSTTTMPDDSVGAGAEAETAQAWWHGCRCGGAYRITQDDLENGTHLVGCESCSEVIWVGYEEVPATEDDSGSEEG